MKKIAVLLLLSTLLTMFTGCACEHEWEKPDSSCETPSLCRKCGAHGDDASSHNWTEATCTESRSCTSCGEAEGEPLGHDWQDKFEYSEPSYCARCGEFEKNDSEDDVSDETEDSGESSNGKDLQNIGFQNMQGYTTWIAIEGYDFTDGYVLVKTLYGDSRYTDDLVFDEKYFTTARYRLDETIELNNRYAYNVIDNDTIDRDQYGNMLFITERKVSDNGKWVVIKTSDKWYMPAEMIQWTTEPEYDSESTHDKLYLK